MAITETEIFDELLTLFYQKFAFLAVIRMLHTFKSQDHVRAAQQVVSCMDHFINLVYKAGWSRTDMLVF